MTAGRQANLPPPHRWIRPLAVSIAVAVALYLGALIVAGVAESTEALARLGAATALAGTLVASLAYLVRFLRWQWLTARLGHCIAPGYNLRVYIAGLALTASPGKLGETVRSVLLMRVGVPVAGSLGAFLADRGADVVGMAALGAVAGLWAGARSPVLELLLVALLITTPLAAWAVRRGWVNALPRWHAPRWPRMARWIGRAASPIAVWARLWTPAAVLGYATFAFVAYGLQALVFAAYVDALGGTVGTLRCLVIFANAMLLGAASTVPGGLGATEAALVYQLVQAGMAMPDAVMAAIVARLSTLWFSILFGVLALLSFAGPNR